MIRMPIQDIAAATGAGVLVDAGAPVDGDVVIDSRKAAPGALFVAFPGERVDGNDYLATAVEAGCAAVVASREPSEGLLALAAERGLSCVRRATTARSSCCAWPTPGGACTDWVVLAVTGSVGKTTTKEMLAAAASSQRRCHATCGNLNNLIGLPLTLMSAPEDSEVVVLVSSA